MELQNPSNGDGGGEGGALEDEGLFLDAAPNEDEEEEEEEEEEEYEESSCSTPFVSAPSSPGNEPSSAMGSAVGLFYSAPTSPVHFALASSFPLDSPSDSPTFAADFEFSARFPAAAAGSMSAADELFLNGQIRPMRLASHLHRPHALPPLPDLDPAGDDDDDDEEIAARGRDLKLRSRSIRRRARSHSPLRNAPLHWAIEDGGGPDRDDRSTGDPDPKPIHAPAPSVPPAAASRSSSSSSSASSSSSSSSRRSKKWIFLKELLNRSKSEGSGGSKERFWSSISFSPSPSPSSSSSKDRSKPKPPAKTKPRNPNPSPPPPRSPASGGGGRRRRVSAPAPSPSPHERLYAANRAHAEEMRRRTFLPYRQGLLLGCLGFAPRSYGAVNGLARGLNAVHVSSSSSSR